MGSRGPEVPQALAREPQFEDWRGRTPLGSLPSLVESATVVVANDSGPMHLAAAVGTPLVALFGPTDPKLYGPWPMQAPQSRVVQAPGGELHQLCTHKVMHAVQRQLEAGNLGACQGSPMCP